MKNLETIGKPLSKAEQKNVLGGSSMTTGDLYCRTTFGGSYSVVTTFSSYDACRANFTSYCYDGSVYESCYCEGDQIPTVCNL